MSRRCSHRIVRYVHIDLDVNVATDAELEGAILLCDVGMSISLAAYRICNKPKEYPQCH